MNEIQLGPQWHDNSLLCPVCGGCNLHQEAVTMYDRVMNPDTVLVTHVHEGNIHVKPMPVETAGNPSADRNALEISFWCESCHGSVNDAPPEYAEYFKLAIQQHKGTTFLNWNVPKK